jgi:nucleotide-binding universal stress UspA family protein
LGIVDHAINMGRTCNSTIFVISVVAFLPESVAYAPQLEEEVSKYTKKILENVKNRIEKENVKCETIVSLDGQPHQPIIQEAK